jgi:ribosomal protein S27AE
MAAAMMLTRRLMAVRGYYEHKAQGMQSDFILIQKSCENCPASALMAKRPSSQACGVNCAKPTASFRTIRDQTYERERTKLISRNAGEGSTGRPGKLM